MTEPTIDQLFTRAVALADAERAELLASLSPDVRRDLESLLESDRTAEQQGYMESSRSSNVDTDPALDGTVAQSPSQSQGDSFSVQSKSTFVSAEESAPDKNADLPDRIGRYSIKRLIATGGLGAVYLGEHPNLEEMNADGELVPQRVAIKVGKRKTAVAEQELVKREASVLCSLDHEHIARVQDLDFHDGLPHLVMEYVSGGSLNQQVKAAPLEVPEALRLVAKVCRAIQYAHEKKILHRDLKPENILMTQQGEPKVIDFGLASLQSAMTDTQDTIPGGTIRYMSPEQAEHAKAGLLGQSATSGQIEDVRVDVFSLGAILYELLTEKRLYEFSDGHEGLDKAIECSIDETPLDRPNIPKSIKAACLKALAKDKTNRFRTAGAFADAIDPPAGRQSSRGSVVVAAIATVVLLFAAIKFFASSDGGPGLGETADMGDLVFRHFANEGEESNPGMLFKNGPARENDDLRIDAAFSDPVYCFLFALNPDGAVQLCYPESEDETQSEPISELHFPVDPESGFRFTDGTGQQMFLLVKSENKLPPFKAWQHVLGTIDGPSKDSGDWVWTENRLTAVNATRGTIAKLKGADGFTSICRRVEQKVGLELHAVSFPIVER